MRRHLVLASLLLSAGFLSLSLAACGDDGAPGATISAGGGSGGGGAAGTSAGGAAGADDPLDSGPKSTSIAMFALPAADGTIENACSMVGGENAITLECTPGFFDHPFPSDARRDEGGRARFVNYPNPYKIPLITRYVTTADRLEAGFSPEAAGWLRFSGGLDPATLPQSILSTREAAASVQLLDVDPASPERGQRRTLDLSYREKEGVYFAPHTLSFRPADGFPLRPATRYALVVTRAVKGLDGGVLRRPAELDAALGLAPAEGRLAALRDAWAPAVSEIEKSGIPRARIAHLTVFTTNDPSAELFAVRDDAMKQPAPTMTGLTLADSGANLDVYVGSYGPTPDYQVGKVPFSRPEDGGSFGFEGGAPIVQRLYDQRFALAVPKPAACPLPEGGYPIVLYAHGTGGDYLSFVDDGTARSLADLCLASMGVDQIFHGLRPGAPQGAGAEGRIQVLFFNFENPLAARTNPRQSAVDEAARARLFSETKAAIPANVAVSGEEIRFDGSKILFYGHSQGGLNGPLFLAADNQARGGVLSGSGSIISLTLLLKTAPQPSVAALVKSTLLALRGPEQQAEATPFHPGISLAQTLIDASDPIHYVGRLLKEPRPGFAPKSIYQTEGVFPSGNGDSYTPPRCIEAQSIATGLPVQEPVIYAFPNMALSGLPVLAVGAEGVSGNLAGGQATGVLAQFSPPGMSDGHFVVFNVPKARKQAAGFCRGLADDPRGRLAPLGP